MAVLGRTTIPNADIGRVSNRGKKDASQVRVLLLLFVSVIICPRGGFRAYVLYLARLSGARVQIHALHAIVAQLVAHRLPKPRVAGSSPVYRSHLRCFIGVKLS